MQQIVSLTDGVLDHPNIVYLNKRKGKLIEAFITLLTIKLKDHKRYLAYTTNYASKDKKEIIAIVLFIKHHDDILSEKNKKPFVTITETFLTSNRLYINFYSFKPSIDIENNYKQENKIYTLPDEIDNAVNDVINHLEKVNLYLV